MIQHYWTLIAKKSHIDQDTNTLIVGEILENIQLGLPKNLKERFEQDIVSNQMVLLPFEFEIISYIGSDKPNEDFVMTMEVELPNHHVAKMGDLKISSGKTGKLRNRFRSNGLPISGSGVNRFRVFEISGKDKRLLAEIPLSIELQFV